MIEISAPDTLYAQIKEAAEKNCAIDHWHSAKNKDGRRTVSILTHLENQQELTDSLQRLMHKEDDWRIVISSVDATIPKLETDDETKNGKAKKIVKGTLTREELYHDVEKGARLDFDFALLVFLSTIVCAIGLIASNVAVVIGAMVIAPLLGPNLALAFGVSLGDKDLTKKAIKANAFGLLMTVGFSIIAGMILNLPIIGTELLDRTEVGFDSIALALASGAAAVLSLTTGLSSTLVGVMVAVALMPPAVAFGLMLGMGMIDYAYGACLLLLANVICINLSAQVVFLIKGIKPRTWYQQKKSKQSVRMTIYFWLFMLVTVCILIAWRDFNTDSIKKIPDTIEDIKATVAP